jgi:Ca2+-binding EF-hand superfamily protein
LSKEDEELQSVCRQISDLAPQKFTTVREAFRYLRPDRNGMANRSDILYFLRAYGVEAEQASRIYSRFDRDGAGSIDCNRFVDFMRPYVAPDGEDMELMAGLTTEQVRISSASPRHARLRSPSTSSSVPKAVGLPAADSPEVIERVTKEFWPILNMVHEKAPQRFSHVREALRIVDVDYDGCITRGEMQNFFRAFGVGEKEADKFYEKLARGGPGGANYHSFVQIVGPYLDLPGMVTATQRASSTSRPGSACSRGRSTPRGAFMQGKSCQRLVLDGGQEALGDRCDTPSPRCARDSNSPREEHNVASRNTSALEAQAQESPEDHQQMLAGRIHPQIRQLPRNMKPCKGRIATPSPTMPSPRRLVLAEDSRQAEKAFRPLSPPAPPAAKKGGRRPLGIQRKELEAEDCSNTMRAALCTADGRPVATPFRRPRSQGQTRCPSPQPC